MQFSGDDIRRIDRAVRLAETAPLNDPRTLRGDAGRSAPLQVVEVTGAEPDSGGNYPARVLDFNRITGGYDALDDCLARDLNGGELSARRYLGRLSSEEIFLVDEPLGPLFVRMVADAVPNSHPDFVQGAANAVAQAWDAGLADTRDEAPAVWVTCPEALPALANAYAANGRPPLRKGDKLWVFRLAPGLWVPAGAPRSAVVKITGGPGPDGLYSATAPVLDGAALVVAAPGASCWVWDLNGLGLHPGYYTAELVDHRAGRCVYVATCCAPLPSDSDSDSESSESDSSDSESVPSEHECIPDACGACPAFGSPWYWRLEAPMSAPGTACAPFAGTHFLGYAGGCTWETAERVDQTASGGGYGPAWTIRNVGGSWLLYAAGTLIGVTGAQPDGCGGDVTWPTFGWTWGGGAHGCAFDRTYPVASPVGDCPSESGSYCPPVCVHCEAAPCVWAASWDDPPAPSGCFSQPTLCDEAPASWAFTGAGFTGQLDGFNGAWTLTPPSYPNVCVYNQVKLPFTFATDPPGAGPDVENISLVAYLTTENVGSDPTRVQLVLVLDYIPNVSGAPLRPPLGSAGHSGLARYVAELDPAHDCCSAVTLALDTSDVNFGPLSGYEAATVPGTLALTPTCAAADTPFAAGSADATSDGDCSWAGAGVAVAFDGATWTATLTASGETADYSLASSDCCGPHTLDLVTATASAPATLTLTAATGCDNCCPSDSDSDSESLPSDACPAICAHCLVAPCEIGVTLEGFVPPGPPCAPCAGCPDATPALFAGTFGGFTGAAAAFGGAWSLACGPACSWGQSRPGTPTSHATLFLTNVGGLHYVLRMVDGAGHAAVYTSGTVTACCDPVTLALESGSAGAAASVTLTPDCSADPPPCGVLNVGAVTLTNSGDCEWRWASGGVSATLAFDGAFWRLTLAAPGSLAVYSAAGSDCCAPPALARELSSACEGPATLVLTALSPCDNCCPSDSESDSSDSGSPGTVPCTSCPDRDLPETLYATVSGQGCPCVGSPFSIPLVWNPATSKWAGSGALGGCGRTVSLALYCHPSEGYFWLDVSYGDSCLSAVTNAIGPTSCDAIDLLFVQAAHACGCEVGGSAPETITYEIHE